MTCRGTTKQGLPCRISWGLDALGFCKFHTQLAAECRGIARSTGQRCRIKWDLNALGFCRFHASQAVDVPRQCVAIAKSTGHRCRVSWGIDAAGLCSVHQRSLAQSQHRRCRGRVLHNGEPCTNAAKPGYAYCCAAHDPSIAHYSPRLFDAADKPRSLLEPEVVRRYDGRDLYHGELLDLVTPGGVELDHILEKQCFSFAFHGLALQDRHDDVFFLTSVVRDEIANELTNLCLTRTTTNKIKGAAVWKFLDDAITGHADDRRSFTDYLFAETRDATRLTRATTGTIVREMGRALKQSQRKLADEGETPLLDELSGELQRLYVKMDLNSSQATTSRLDAKAKPFIVSRTEEPPAKGPAAVSTDSEYTGGTCAKTGKQVSFEASDSSETTVSQASSFGKKSNIQVADVHAGDTLQVDTANESRKICRDEEQSTQSASAVTKPSKSVAPQATSQSSLAKAIHAKPFIPRQLVCTSSEDVVVEKTANAPKSDAKADEDAAGPSCTVSMKWKHKTNVEGTLRVDATDDTTPEKIQSSSTSIP